MVAERHIPAPIAYPAHPRTFAELPPEVLEHAARVYARVCIELAREHPEWIEDEAAHQKDGAQ